MNLGYYEIMDRVSLIQNNLEDYVRHHDIADDKVRELVDKAQEILNDLYQYASENFNDEWEKSL